MTRRAVQPSRTFTARGQREADRRAAAVEAELRADIEQRRQRRGTVAELVEVWLRDQQRNPNVSPATLARYPTICARISDALGRHPVDKLTARHIEDWYAALRETVTNRGRPMSESTVHHHHRILSAILRSGERWDMVTTNPMRRVVAPNSRTTEIMLPSDAELERLLTALPDHVLAPVLVDVTTGLRRGELFGLRWSAVSFPERSLHVRNNTVQVNGRLHDKGTKGGRSRTVPLTDQAVAALVEHRRRLEAAAAEVGVTLAPDARVMADVVADPSGVVPLRPDWLSQYWARHCRRLGVRVRLHDLRHWYASRLLDRGVALPVVQSLLGHASPTTTLGIYGHARDGSREATRGLLALEI